MSSSNQYLCVGTKRISINDGEYNGNGDACISLFRLRPSKRRSSPSSANAPIEGRDWRSPSPRESFDNNTTVDDCLHLMATDGELTFYKCIAAKDIKHMTSESTPEQLLDKVESILLQRKRTVDEDQIFKVAYKMMGGQVFGGTQDTTNTVCIKASIRKTLANQIVRPIWEGNLIPISHTNYDSLPVFIARHALPNNNNASDQFETPSSLTFSIILGDTITKLQKDITALREENEQLKLNSNRWKGTAQKLNCQWQSEKSELTERFLTLFNEHKARHIEVKKELDKLKGNQRYERGSTETLPLSAHKERPEARLDDEDEHDYATYDDDYVNRMAAGGLQNQKRRRKYVSATTQFNSDDEDEGHAMEV